MSYVIRDGARIRVLWTMRPCEMAADTVLSTYLPSRAMTTRLLAEGDLDRGHPPDLTLVINAHS